MEHRRKQRQKIQLTREWKLIYVVDQDQSAHGYLRGQGEQRVGPKVYPVRGFFVPVHGTALSFDAAGDPFFNGAWSTISKNFLVPKSFQRFQDNLFGDAYRFSLDEMAGLCGEYRKGVIQSLLDDSMSALDRLKSQGYEHVVLDERSLSGKLLRWGGYVSGFPPEFRQEIADSYRNFYIVDEEPHTESGTQSWIPRTGLVGEASDGRLFPRPSRRGPPTDPHLDK